MMDRPLPKGWKWVRLGDVDDLEIIMGQSPPSSTYNADGIGLPFYQGKAEFGEYSPITIKWCSKPIKIAKPDDILISVRAPVGDVNICEITSCIGRGLAAIRTNKRLDNKFLYYYLKKNINIWRRFATGSTFDSISSKTIHIFPIPLPPLPTQKKIVKILEEADNLRKLRQAADKKMKELIPSLFVKMFGDPTTNPKGWKVKRIGEIASKEKFSIRMGPFGSQLKKHELVSKGIKVLWIENIVNNKFEWRDNKCVTPEKYQQLKGFQVKPKDILTTTMGTIGKSCVVPENIGQAIISSHLLKITLDLSIAVPEFVAEYIRLPYSAHYFNASSHGVVMKGLNTTIIKNLPIYLPPLSLQREFAERVKEIEAEKARQAESRKKLDDLFNSLMQRAFIGELVT